MSRLSSNQELRRPASRPKVLAFMAALACEARHSAMAQGYLAELLAVVMSRGAVA